MYVIGLDKDDLTFQRAGIFKHLETISSGRNLKDADSPTFYELAKCR